MQILILIISFRNKQSSKNDDFDFDFGASSSSNQNKKSDAFDFDSFGQELSTPASSADPFADMNQPKSSATTGLEDVIFGQVIFELLKR